ncbi:MAG: N(G),N(G)-dimethylarginine dimethylaminohydrolase [Chloroflexi bacterium HGW-Chloroflexi-10]|nr:MAG: N(G),N(G)-dimethylarginine dimethylaminohydrolase [Chloroflexi bacterium HGW-Chloroflexi-10]
MSFQFAITRQPAESYIDGITTANLGRPEMPLARAQHAAYVQALTRAGLQVSVLPPTPAYPDSVFVEDAAIVEADFAVLSRPGADSRRGETTDMLPVLAQRFTVRYQIENPGTLDGGDICKVGARYFLGVSQRTNPAGAQQLAGFLSRHGFTCEIIDIRGMQGILHLKSAVNSLGENTLLLDPRLANHPSFNTYRKLIVPLEEAYAANCLRVNDIVLVPDGFPATLELVSTAGFTPVVMQVSEYHKMDGGLSCLSLRW